MNLSTSFREVLRSVEMSPVSEIQPRMMAATFNGNPSATIISYSPTNVNEEIEISSTPPKIDTQEDFHGILLKKLERYNKCIAAGGDYFEGD